MGAQTRPCAGTWLSCAVLCCRLRLRPCLCPPQAAAAGSQVHQRNSQPYNRLPSRAKSALKARPHPAPRRRLQLQERFLELIRGDERFEVVVPPRFGLICFRFKAASDEQSEQLLEAINATGG